jgi:hypothetical protein
VRRCRISQESQLLDGDATSVSKGRRRGEVQRSTRTNPLRIQLDPSLRAPIHIFLCPPPKNMASSKTSGQKPKFVLKRQRTESEPSQPPRRVRVDEPSKLKSKLKKSSAPKAAAPPQPQKGAFVKAKGKETTKPKPAIPSVSGKAIKTKAKAATAPPTPDPLPTAFKVIAGSYEKLLYGLQGSASLSDEGSLSFSLKPVFIFPAHVSSVKALAASPGGGKWLASGSVDEIIKVWDLRRRKEVGGLMHHSGMSLLYEFCCVLLLMPESRVNYTPHLRRSLAPLLRIRGRHSRLISYPGLGYPSNFQRS